MKTKNEKLPYEKPLVRKEEHMTFPLEILRASYHELACRQCSSCHGCR